ncbi:phage Gp37/Gp68 family protein [Cupriavidus sp. WS]|uniref:phage Gp37/Gp68 family protein n=1 Tax=Cupriavidus sp. WS TaxID=1312922 RepID=UPI000365E1B2|nr:phage Gp37/Gp68 family protein [Cupriavidus sp. WS]
MSENSNIEWCDHTFSPWEGCQKVGPGCDHCYAERRNARFGGGTAPNWGPGAQRRRTSDANWRKPLRWNAAHAAFAAVHGRRQRVFFASLADIFDNEVPIEWFIDVLDLWRQTPNLDKLVLTKRIGNASKRLGDAFNTLMLRDDCADNPLVPWLATWIAGNPPADIWLGATVVNQAEADRDIPKLLRTPAKLRFLSLEPLLGPVNVFSTITGELLHTSGNDCSPGAIDWIIAGGESGPEARYTLPDSFRSLRDQCAAAGVPYLFKRWGEWHTRARNITTGEAVFRTFESFWQWASKAATWIRGGICVDRYGLQLKTVEDFTRARDDGRFPVTVMHRVGTKAAGRLLDGVLHDAFPNPSDTVYAACGRALSRAGEARR